MPALHLSDIEALDNLGSDKVAGVEESMTAAAAQLCFLPPCNPDFKLNEQVFSKMRTYLRKVAKRTVE